MQWNNIFKPVTIVTEAEAKDFMQSHKTDSYQLVDVRMHEEYQEEHIPGATLIPLNQLVTGAGNLDPEKPTIVYCRSGGRSQAASQWMTENGFKEVYDISSNIRHWLGIRLEGEYESDLSLIKKDVDFPDAFTLSYAMEEGLQQFYYALEAEETDEAFKQIYKRLAGFEDLHKAQLKKAFVNQTGQQFDVEGALAKQGDVIEGGEGNRKSPLEVISQMKDHTDIYGLALAIEAQSFDLYVRLANKTEDQESKKLLMTLADEEKSHMEYISQEMTKYLQANN